MMQYRILGKTHLKVSAVGFGTWGMGGWWGPKDDRSAIEALEKAVEKGICFFDTALVYGDGYSENLLGNVFKKRREQVIIATKIPPKNYQWPAQSQTPIKDAFPKKWMIECTQKSLQNLGMDYVDLQQLHVWTDAWLDSGEWQEGCEELKKRGLIRSFGVSINDHAPETALKIVSSGKIDSVQVIYNLFDQSPAEELFPLCQKYGVGVIARVPFDEGGLTGALALQTRFHPDDWRKNYFTPERLRETVERVDSLKKDLVRYGESLPGTAIRFCIAHPAVGTVIPGMRRPEHVIANCKVPEKELPAQLLQELKSYSWIRDFYQGTACRDVTN